MRFTFGVALIVSAAAQTAGQAQQPDGIGQDGTLPSAVWRNVPGNVAVEPARSVVGRFLQGIVDKDVQLCDFAFVDLNKDGVNELVAAVDFSGREFCNTVVVIAKYNEQFQATNIPAWNVTKISAVLKDLVGDGSLALVVPEPYSDYDGPNCVATAPAVYRFDGLVPVKVSMEFRGVFDSRLQELDRAIQKIQGRGDLSSDEKALLASCDILEHDKISRLLGIDQRAGFTQALEWMRSKNPSLRRKAVTVLEDIGDRESRQRLQTLSRDSDTSIAIAARRGLERRGPSIPPQN